MSLDIFPPTEPCLRLSPHTALGLCYLVLISTFSVVRDYLRLLESSIYLFVAIRKVLPFPLAKLPAPRQHPFRLGITLSSRLCLPVAFRLLAFAFWSIPFPLRNSAVLTVGLLDYQTSLGLSCSASWRFDWGGCPLYSGVVVSFNTGRWGLYP